VTGLLPRGTVTECRPVATHRCDWCEEPATGRRPYTVDCPYTGRISVRYEYACEEHASYIEEEMQAERSELGESDVCREFQAITPDMILAYGRSR
jgi:hypothetical protein